MTPLQLKWAVRLLGLVVLVRGYFLFQASRDDAKKTAATLEQVIRTDKAASDIATESGATKAEVQRVEVVVTQARQTYQQQYQEVKREDPDVAGWAGGAVPDRLRDLARTRREQRERSGCTGDGCAGPH